MRVGNRAGHLQTANFLFNETVSPPKRIYSMNFNIMMNTN